MAAGAVLYFDVPDSSIRSHSALGLATSQCSHHGGEPEVEILQATVNWYMRSDMALPVPAVLKMMRKRESTAEIGIGYVLSEWHTQKQFRCLLPCGIAMLTDLEVAKTFFQNARSQPNQFLSALLSCEWLQPEYPELWHILNDHLKSHRRRQLESFRHAVEVVHAKAQLSRLATSGKPLALASALEIALPALTASELCELCIAVEQEKSMHERRQQLQRFWAAAWLARHWDVQSMGGPLAIKCHGAETLQRLEQCLVILRQALDKRINPEAEVSAAEVILMLLSQAVSDLDRSTIKLLRALYESQLSVADLRGQLKALERQENTVFQGDLIACRNALEKWVWQLKSVRDERIYGSLDRALREQAESSTVLYGGSTSKLSSRECLTHWVKTHNEAKLRGVLLYLRDPHAAGENQVGGDLESHHILEHVLDELLELPGLPPAISQF